LGEKPPADATKSKMRIKPPKTSQNVVLSTPKCTKKTRFLQHIYLRNFEDFLPLKVKVISISAHLPGDSRVLLDFALPGDVLLVGPSKSRYAFTTWNYFAKEAVLTSSGLLGPVKIVSEV